MEDRVIKIKLVGCAGHEAEFTSLNSLYEFFRSEDAFWRQFKEEIPSQWRNNNKYVEFGMKFKSAADAIEGWSDLDSTTDLQLNQKIGNIKNVVLKGSSVEWLWSGLPFTHNYMNYLKEYGATRANSFVSFILGKGFTAAQNTEEFQGQLYGYEYLNPSSDIVGRTEGEKVSLTVGCRMIGFHNEAILC